jgi:hypothetical protein
VGQAVEVPMFESVAHFVLGDHSAGLITSPIVDSATRGCSRDVPTQRDGYICVLVYNDKMEELLRRDQSARDD